MNTTSRLALRFRPALLVLVLAVAVVANFLIIRAAAQKDANASAAHAKPLEARTKLVAGLRRIVAAVVGEIVELRRYSMGPGDFGWWYYHVRWNLPGETEFSSQN